MTLEQTLAAESTTGQVLPAVKLNGTNQAMAVGAASVQSSAFGTGVSLVRIASSVDCYLAFGTNPTATTSTVFLPAGVVEYVAVQSGWKVAHIRLSSSGIITVTEIL